LIIGGQLLDSIGEKAKVFMIAIQLAAIFAVVLGIPGAARACGATLHTEPGLAAGWRPI